jgi:hypothetical protein
MAMHEYYNYNIAKFDEPDPKFLELIILVCMSKLLLLYLYYF